MVALVSYSNQYDSPVVRCRPAPTGNDLTLSACRERTRPSQGLIAGDVRPLLVLGLVIGFFVFMGMVRAVQGGPDMAAGAEMMASESSAVQAATAWGAAPQATSGATNGDLLIVAQPGDSMWSIVTEVAPDRDPRPIIQAMKERNGGSEVRIGQEIVIPIELID